MSFRQTITSVTMKGSRARSLAALLALMLIASGTVVSACTLLGAARQATPEVRATLRQTGFEPSEVRREAGRVRLTVENRSGVEGLRLRLVRRGGGVVRESQIAQGAAEWSEEFDLQAGTYVLTEANNPAWLFYVIVN